MGIFRKPASHRKHRAPAPNAFETSIAIELNDGDLLDIDGSDDQTMAFANRAAKRLAAKGRLPAAVRANVKVPEDLRLTNPIERQAEIYPEPPTLLATQLLPRAAKSARKPQTPAHFWRPNVRPATESGVSESYPPVAVMTEAQAELKLGGSTKSPWGWVAAAVVGTMLLIGASLRAAPQVDTAMANASQPPPAAVEVAPKADDAKVVKFDDAVAVTRSAPKPAPHRAWTAPWKKPAPKVTPVAEKPEKPEKPTSPAANAKSAEQKELEDLQLKAASR